MYNIYNNQYKIKEKRIEELKSLIKDNEINEIKTENYFEFAIDDWDKDEYSHHSPFFKICDYEW